MTLLIMDTSGAFAVLALAEPKSGKVLAVHQFESRRLLSRRLLGQMDALLQSEHVTLDEISSFAVGLGPGSFTGVRVGVTTMKTLAQVTGKPLVGIGTLDAYGVLWQGDARLVPVLASRRGECYTATYANGVCVDGPRALPFDVLAQSLAQMADVIVCGDLPVIQEALVGQWEGKILHQPAVPSEGLAQLAAVRLNNGRTDDLLALAPLYIVPPVITTPKDVPHLPWKESPHD